MIALVMMLATTSCASKKNNEGWENLLADGTKAWHTYGKTTVTSAWALEDGGILHFSPKGKVKADKGDLVTNQEFENFHLQLEWKISKKGNSGVMFLVNDDYAKYKQPYLTGPEMQVLDNDGHPDAKIHKHRAGDLYDLIPCKRETVKPTGEWNKAEIILNKSKLQLILNGEKVVETMLWDQNWNEMVAASKFKNMPDFAKYKKGKIALQDHGDEVWYRNIRIKKL